MTKTGKIAKLNKLNPGPFVEIHPDDAARLQISDDDPVEIASRRGRAVLPAVITDRVRPGNCFAPFHWNDVFGEYLSINAVTNDAVDPISRQPEFKACAVTLTKVAVSPNRIRTPIPAIGDRNADPRPRGAEISVSQVDALAELLGVANEPTPQFGPLGRSYLAGSARRAAFGGRPAHDRGAHPAAQRPVRSRHPAVGGRCARRAVRAHRGPAAAVRRRTTSRAARATEAAPERAPIVVLWASQTGNAEELAADVARAARRGRAAGRVAQHGRFRARRPGDNARSCW